MTQSPSLKINNYQHLEEILWLTVETARTTLKCDRAIIYDASELPKSEVIAESVNSKCTSILGKIMVDPFLTLEYLEVYSYGRAVAIDNISRLDLSKIKLKELERLNIKSLSIAPISVNNKLLAFLAVHQCSRFRSWNSEAIKFLSEKANTAGFALANIIKAQKSELRNDVHLAFSHSKLITKQIEIAKNQINKNSLTVTMDRKNGNGNGNIPSSEQKTEIQESKISLFSDVNQRIANEVGQNNILNTAVNELRHLLNCDRMLVYSLNPDKYGVIIAESIGAGWAKALGKTIDDPCFAARYIEKYSQGRVRAWNNIYCEDATPCYLEQLEALGVKAKVVAPIIQENQLFGLLIAHQCSDTRHWQEEEISWITETATQVGLMLEHTEKFAKTDSESPKLLAASENKWNQHFIDAIQYIRQSIDREDILKASVKEVRRVLNCDRVVVYSMNSDNYGMIVAESVASGWIKSQGRVIKDPCFETKYLEKYRNGRVRAWSNIYEAGLTKCYIEQLEQLEVKANLVTPIINEGKLFGLLVAHQCSDFRTWQQFETRWVAQITTQVGFALDNAKLLADAKQLQHQLENEAKLTKYFTDAIRYIRESLQEEDILEITVEEVRRVLNCDRVVVYSMNSDNHGMGMIVAESVAPGWTRSQGRVIKDPCFEAKYLEKYRNGRVRAWNNIYEAGMTECYIEQLERLEIKANLVTPIVNEGKLFGLLVAHQCSDFRTWQQPEIRWVTQIATQVSFALDNAKLLVEAKQLKQQVQSESKWTEYFTDAIQHIRESLKTEDILTTSVKEVRRILNCDRVVIYSMNSDERGEIVAESVTPGWTRAKGRVIEDPCFEARYLEKYRNGRVRAWDNIYEAGMTKCYIEQLEQLEIKANLVAPIINEGKLYGLLVAHQCSDFRTWQQAEISWVAQIATQVGFALDNAKLLEQLQESTQTNSQISHQQDEETKALKNQIVEILKDNGDAYQTLSHEAMRQSETTINVLYEIQKVADSFNGIASNMQQAKLQEQQSDLAVRDTQESLERAVNSLANLKRTVQSVAVGFDNLSGSAKKLAETVNTIRGVSKQIVQQSMNMIKAVSRSKTEADSQNAVIDLSDTIFSLMQELYEASAKVEPLFINIQTEVREKTITLDSGTQQLINDVGVFQSVRQKLDRVQALHNKMNNLIESISQSLENQTQSSTFAKDSVEEVASIAERISQQSMTITQSFNQLIILVQKP